MNETAERRQGAENACQRLRRRVLTATAALAAAALVFGWLAAGAVRRSEVFTWGSLEVSFTGEGFTGSPAVGEGVSDCAPAVNVQPGSEACYLFLALGKTGGQQWGHWAGGAFAPGPLEGWSPLEGTDGAVYYCQVEAVGKKEAAVRIQLFDRVQGGAPGEGAPFQVYAIQSRGLATPGQAWQALTG